MAEPRGEVTFVFTDIVGSTRLWQQHGDRTRAAVEQHDAIVEGAVLEAGGTVVKTLGDGAFAAFGDAGSAIDAAVAIQRRLSDARPTSGVPLHVRIGLHTGTAQPHRGDYHGTVVNRCARIAAAAHGDQIVCSLDTARAAAPVDDGIGFTHLGTHRLRDLQRAEALVQVVHPDLPDRFPPLRTLEGVPNNLPGELSSFVGRVADVAAVVGALEESRLVTLTGAGGSGKTRLALQVAAEQSSHFPDGVWVVELAGLHDASHVGAATASALSLPDEPGHPPSAAVAHHLADRTALLVLDNCEHVLDGVAPFVESLLRTAPAVRVLATSREALAVPGEVRWPVPPLPVPAEGCATLRELSESDAGRLFLERSVAVAPDLHLEDADASAIARICRVLDGLPLAVELAAARTAVLGPAEIAERLRDRFAVLTSGSRTSLPRQRTLEATVSWSYDLLDPADRWLFERLAVFAGGAMLASIERVAPDAPADVLTTVTRLVDRSLLSRETTAVGTRFRMLDTVRAYALQRLDEAGDVAVMRARHLEAMVAFSEEAGRELDGRSQRRWLAAVEDELDDVRAALRWAVEVQATEPGLRIASALYRYWFMRGVREGLAWHEELLASGADVADAVAAKASYTTGSLLQIVGEFDRSAQLLERSVALYRELGNSRGLGYALHYLGRARWQDPDRAAVRARFAEANEHFRAAGDLLGLGLGLLFITLEELEDGHLDAAEAATVELNEHFSRIGAPQLVAHGHEATFWVARRRAMVPRAASSLDAALVTFLEINNAQCAAHCLDGAALFIAERGDLERAALVLGGTQALRDRIGIPPPPWETVLAGPAAETVRAGLGAERAASLRERGRSLDLAGTIAEARRAIQPA